MRTLLVNAPLCSGTVTITEQEAHHALHVLRLTPGDLVRLCDGAGHAGQATVVDCSRHALHCEIGVVDYEEPPAAALLEILAAVPKGNRFEDMVRSLTELGVGRIQPLQTERSQQQVKLDRPRRVAGEALKQCGRTHLPEIGPVVDFSTVKPDPDLHMLLDASGSPLCAGLIRRQVLIIGPEGGLSPREREHLISHGVKAFRLAPHVLRIETAAIAAAAHVIASWESE
jgi:16S rRNA (uracil1498-N3)-methyltransferase